MPSIARLFMPRYRPRYFLFSLSLDINRGLISPAMNSYPITKFLGLTHTDMSSAHFNLPPKSQIKRKGS